MYYLFYNALLWLLTLTVLPIFALYSWLSKKHWPALGRRFRLDRHLALPPEGGPRIWLHGASVGEVQVARALIAELQRTVPEATVILSTVTEQGQKVARKQLPPEVLTIYAPLDLRPTVDKFIATLRPTIYVCLETELWPNIIRQLHRRKVPLVLLNGRISASSFKNYSKVKGFTTEILASFAALATIRAEDRERFLALGADPDKMTVLGNAKYDLGRNRPAPAEEGGEDGEALPARYRSLLGLAADQPLLLAGSTHAGEEEAMLTAYRELKATIGNLVLVLAPRHLRRVPAVAALLATEKCDFTPFSQLPVRNRPAEVVLLDTMGELASLYAVATYVFCGGSLVERGGHNIMEAAVWGKPIFYGPHMKDFADAKELLEAEQASFPIRHPQEMVAAILALHADQEAYQALRQRVLRVAQAQHHSARAQVRLLRAHLPHGRPGPDQTY